MTTIRACLCLFLLALGCGGDDAATVVDAATIDASDPDAEPACNAVAPAGAEVIETGVATAAPAALGGAIVDGTYHVTARVIYTGVGGAEGPSGFRVRATSVNTAGQFEYSEAANTGATFVGTGTYAITDEDIVVTFTCPAETGISPYTEVTATATEFTLYDRSQLANVTALTFTKQP